MIKNKLLVFLAIMVFGLAARTSFAQEFTATSLGDYGNVTVMEVTGNYDEKTPEENINRAPREVIAKEFFKTHKDEYDFLVVFTKFEFVMGPDTAAFYSPSINNTLGTGQDQFNYSAAFGSTDKLQGMIDMGDIGNLTDPQNQNFKHTLNTLSHELMHRWAAHLRLKNADGSFSTALLGKDGSHWSFLFDSGGSTQYGNRWQDNGNGTFTSLTPYQDMKLYGSLDLYLMGMIDKARVPPMLLIENPDIDPTRLPEANVTISGIARTVTIDDIIAANGSRVPDASSSQKTFKTAFILVTRPGTFTGDEIYGIENIRNSFVTRHSILTDGQSIVQVASTVKEDIPSNPEALPPSTTPRTLPPSIDDGVQWLMANQGSDGSWMDLGQTMERDTAVTVMSLRSFPVAQQHYQNGVQWLAATQSMNLDYLARKVQTLAGAGQDVADLVQEIVARQNPDGGWGGGAFYASGNADTALALQALTAAGYGDAGVLSKAIGFLRSQQNADGGWGSEDRGGMVRETSNVLSAFNPYRNAYQLDDAISRGTTWLANRKNADGGFGPSTSSGQAGPSTVYDTAAAVTTLRELDAPPSNTNFALAYLLGKQSENGSWNQSAYETALAVKAVFRATVDPDLSVTSSDISIIPETITSLPSNIVINANISNLGQTGAQARVVLYDGDPASGYIIGEQTLMFPGQSATTLTFATMVKDGSEYRYTIVIDPDDLVSESNKLNNSAIKILSPEATYDFEVLSSDITVSPNPADMFQDVKITSGITNKGTMNAYNVQVKYFLALPGTPFNIATQTADILSGATITTEFTWRANKAGVDMPLSVQADPFNTFTEISEENNQGSIPLTVNGSTLPNLTISYKDIVITPNPANENGNVNIAALVRNEGSSDATDINVSFYRGVPGADGLLLGEQTIPSLSSGQSVTVALDWMNIPESGEKILYLQVDPSNAVTEIREDDNDAFTTVNILSLPDLVLAINSIMFSPAAPKEGDPVTITVTVQNRGEQSVSNAVVRLSEGTDVLGNQTIPSIAGGATGTVSLVYDTAGKKGAHTITAIGDPDNAIAEQSTDNNSASRTLGVQDSSLWVTEQYISPNGDGVKDSTEFIFRLEAAATVSVRVVNKKNDTVRSFTGPELVNITGGSIHWDGFNESGVVVDDGEYQLQVMDSSGSMLAAQEVVVDNNRSPLTDAIGTPYLMNSNLTCELPDIYDEHWDWLPDDSGIVFSMDYTSYVTPEYPNGVYTMSPDGGDIFRVCILTFNLLILHEKSIVTKQNQQGGIDEAFERTRSYS